MIPPKPNVKQPWVWSWPVQEILTKASYAATVAMVEAEHGKKMSAIERLTRTNDLADRIGSDPDVAKAYYHRVVTLIPTIRPKAGFSSDGPSVDRAEAKLLFWLGHQEKMAPKRRPKKATKGDVRKVSAAPLTRKLRDQGPVLSHPGYPKSGRFHSLTEHEKERR